MFRSGTPHLGADAAEAEELGIGDPIPAGRWVRGGVVQVAVGVGGLEIDISFEVVARDGNGEFQEGERGIRYGPGELEVGVKGVSKIDELSKLLMGVRGRAKTVIDVTEKEVGDSASVAAEEGLFHVPYKEA
eukprot:g20092.t1